jgi:hypothetical protein
MARLQFTLRAMFILVGYFAGFLACMRAAVLLNSSAPFGKEMAAAFMIGGGAFLGAAIGTMFKGHPGGASRGAALAVLCIISFAFGSFAFVLMALGIVAFVRWLMTEEGH